MRKAARETRGERKIRFSRHYVSATLGRMCSFRHGCKGGEGNERTWQFCTLLHCSPLSPRHVPRMLRQTLPSEYKLGLKRVLPPFVVRNTMCGADEG
jgi:hypothetical protein